MRLLLFDPWIAAQIDEVVAPYKALLPPADLAWMREQLAQILAADETAALLLRGARPREVEESGEVECEPGDLDEVARDDADDARSKVG